MTATADPIYSDITINPSVYTLTFPDTAQGSIKPGSLNRIKAFTIVWVKNMTDLIEPGVIPNNVLLVLPETYLHPIDLSQLGPATRVCLYSANNKLGPTDRCFKLWSKYEARTDTPVCLLDHNHCGTSLKGADLGLPYVYVFAQSFTWIPQVTDSAPVEPLKLTDLEQVQDQANQDLREICVEGDYEAVTNYINANHQYLQLGYGDYMVLKELIECKEHTLCKLLHERLGPIDASVLRRLAGEVAHTEILESVLDLASSLELNLVETEEQYVKLLRRVCSSQQTLDLSKRVYELWSISFPASAFVASCYSWDREKIDYFEGLLWSQSSVFDPACKGACCRDISRVSIMLDVIRSGNTYAFRRLMSSCDITRAPLSNMHIKGTDQYILFEAIKACSEEKTGTMITDLIRCISRSAIISIVGSITGYGTTENFWEQCVEAVRSVCKQGNAEAIEFFMDWLRPYDPDHIKLFLQAAPSELAIRTIIQGAGLPVMHEVARDLAESGTTPMIYACLIGYYRTLANTLDQLQYPGLFD